MNQVAKTGAGFALQPQNIQEAMQMADMLAKSQMVPKCYQNKPQDTLVAMMMGSELGLNPIQALQNIAVINGKPSIYGDAMLALVQNHPAFGGIKETYDENAMVATCTVWRKEGESTRSPSARPTLRRLDCGVRLALGVSTRSGCRHSAPGALRFVTSLPMPWLA